MENVWLLHRGGFTPATRCDVADPDTGKLCVRLVPSGEELLVDEEDVEKVILLFIIPTITIYLLLNNLYTYTIIL